VALILKNGVFIHIAKTGGSWVAELLRQQGLVAAATARSHVNFKETISEVPAAAGLPSFAFVRHPVTWWKSYWAYRMKTGWDPNHPVDKVSQSEVFEDFIRKMLDRAPGYHDHNWGRWHWGQDLGWEWGCFLPPAPGLFSTSLRHRTIFFTVIAIFSSSITRPAASLRIESASRLDCTPRTLALRSEYTTRSARVSGFRASWG
jgi:hypothetical protein